MKVANREGPAVANVRPEGIPFSSPFHNFSIILTGLFLLFILWLVSPFYPRDLGASLTELVRSVFLSIVVLSLLVCILINILFPLLNCIRSAKILALSHLAVIVENLFLGLLVVASLTYLGLYHPSRFTAVLAAIIPVAGFLIYRARLSRDMDYASALMDAYFKAYRLTGSAKMGSSYYYFENMMTSYQSGDFVRNMLWLSIAVTCSSLVVLVGNIQFLWSGAIGRPVLAVSPLSLLPWLISGYYSSRPLTRKWLGRLRLALNDRLIIAWPEIESGGEVGRLYRISMEARNKGDALAYLVLGLLGLPICLLGLKVAPLPTIPLLAVMLYMASKGYIDHRRALRYGAEAYRLLKGKTLYIRRLWKLGLDMKDDYRKVEAIRIGEYARANKIPEFEAVLKLLEEIRKGKVEIERLEVEESSEVEGPSTAHRLSPTYHVHFVNKHLKFNI